MRCVISHVGKICLINLIQCRGITPLSLKDDPGYSRTHWIHGGTNGKGENRRCKVGVSERKIKRLQMTE